MEVKISKNMLLSVYGADKTGKTRLILDMPKPLGVLILDRRPGVDYEAKIKAGEKIEYGHFPLYRTTFADYVLRDAKMQKMLEDKPEQFYDEIENLRANKEINGKYRAHLRSRNDIILQQLLTKMREYINNPKLKSIAIDGASNLWNLICYAIFGKAAKIQQFDYGELRSQMALITDELESAGKEIIIASEDKKEYSNGAETGMFTNQGDGKLRFRVKTNVYLWATDGDSLEDRFHLRIRNSAENADLVGFELHGGDIQFDIVKAIILGE